jgi:hypothetical protein
LDLKSLLVIDANLDDPWFKKRTVRVRSLANYTADGISAINVRLRYGDDVRNVILQPPAAGAVAPAPDTIEWLSILDGPAMRRDVAVDYDVFFTEDDKAEHDGKASVTLPVLDGDEVLVSPRADHAYEVLTIPVRVGDGYPFDRYPTAEVHLRHKTAAGRESTAVMQFRKSSTEQVWQVFQKAGDPKTIDYRVVHRALSNRDIDTGFHATDDEEVVVRDPFPSKRTVQFVPAVDWNKVERILVDASYADPTNNVFDEASFEFTKDAKAGQAFVVELHDPTQRAVEYSVTTITAAGDVHDVPRSVTREQRVVISEKLRGHRSVAVQLPPIDFAAARLRQVSVHATYEDLDAGLVAADDLLFSHPDDVRFFEFDYADPAKTSFHYVTTSTSVSNATRSTPDQTADDSLVVVTLP